MLGLRSTRLTAKRGCKRPGARAVPLAEAVRPGAHMPAWQPRRGARHNACSAKSAHQAQRLVGVTARAPTALAPARCRQPGRTQTQLQQSTPAQRPAGAAHHAANKSCSKGASLHFSQRSQRQVQITLPSMEVTMLDTRFCLLVPVRFLVLFDMVIPHKS